MRTLSYSVQCAALSDLSWQRISARYFKAIDDCGEDGCVLLPIAVEDFASASKGVAEKSAG